MRQRRPCAERNSPRGPLARHSERPFQSRQVKGIHDGHARTYLGKRNEVLGRALFDTTVRQGDRQGNLPGNNCRTWRRGSSVPQYARIKSIDVSEALKCGVFV
jgi:hypothetical protein